MITLIIFDWDDVFSLGSQAGYFTCYHTVLEKLGITLDPKEERKRILSRWGQTSQREIAALLKEHPELIKKGCAIYEKQLFGNTFIDHIRVVPGVQALLLRLHKHYTLALASGVHPKLLKERIMLKFEIPNVFAHIITGEDLADASKTKPHPYIAQEIMRLTNIPREQTVMVGDAKNDVLMAQRAGITPVVVLTGTLQRKEAEELGVRYIIEDVTKIENVLNEINKA